MRYEISEEVEREMVLGVQRGDNASFKRLYELYKDRVFSLCIHMTGDSEEAKELTQQIFVKVHTHSRSFAFKSSFRTWLFRLCMNTCLDYLRQRKRRRAPEEDADKSLSAQHFSTIEERIDRDHIALIVRNTIQDLSPKLREVIVLRYLEGLSYEEMADVLEVSSGTVASRLNLSHKVLAKKLHYLRGVL